MSEPTKDFISLRVGPGMHVQVELRLMDGELEKMEFDIVPDEGADFATGFLGVSTPLAKAVLGRRAGNSVPYHVGDALEVKILSVTPGKDAPIQDIAARRQGTIQKAIEEAERTSAMMFASSFSGKWGDYNPDSIAKNMEKDEGEKHQNSKDNGD